MPKVKVYSTKICPYCQMVKEYLLEKGVEFEEILVDEDSDAAQEMVAKSKQMGVPVTIVENNGSEEVIVGFDKAKLDAALEVAEGG